MFANCPAWWNSDDFTRCFSRDIIQTLLPLLACALSLLFLLIRGIRLWIRSSKSHSYRALKHNASSNGNGFARHGRDSFVEDDEEDEDADTYVDDDDDDEDTDELQRNEELVLQPTRSRNNQSIVTIHNRPRTEILVAVVEELGVLAALGGQIAGLILHLWGRHGTLPAIANVLVWAYIAALTSLRLYSTFTPRVSFTLLWSHTAILYGFQWLVAVIVFRSEIIRPTSKVAQIITSIHFAINTCLFLIAVTSRRGNTGVELEYEGDMEPSPEPLASVLSDVCFFWVDALVYKGWKKDLEITDLWNLIPQDKAATILANYRQVKKTSILAWHLLKFFRREFLIQGAWSVVNGVVTFVPTLLLKVILEYVEDPRSIPRNAAWLYVVLLFVSGLVTALANGQALWIGRKVCIRLRAIIIGEIYAKSLRRRAAATSDKVLGMADAKKPAPDEDDQKKPNLLKRIMTFGRKKKSSDAQADNEAQQTPQITGQEEPKDDSTVTSGAIINLMAVDSFKVADISAYLQFLWAETPVQFVLAIVLLYQILGRSSVVGIILMALLLPVNMYVAKKFTQIQKLILAATDARIHTTNEVLTNIRIIKYFAWEQRFLGLVDEKRVVELRHLRNRYILYAAAATIWSGAPILITFFTFLVYTLVEGKDLIPSIAFTALSLFSLLRIPLDQLADMVAHVQESKVSVDRVEEYLNEPETDKYNQLRATELDEDGEPLIGFDGATFSWGGARDADDFKMIDLDIQFKVGQLNVVIGPTGSGKTSLLMALLGEMSLLDGDVYLPGGRSREDLKPNRDTSLIEAVAYCAQQAWLINGTIKENITFASPWDARRYKQTIVACSLQRDLEILDSGDETLVGEKGVTLSGGQKQRISLARALYCNARHVLLDDVLSAVDSHTAKWIFDKALMGPLMYNRTCILVTHNAVLCLPQAEHAVVLDNGRVAVQGPPAEVIASGKLAEDMSKLPSRPQSRAASTLPSRVPSGIGGDAETPFGQPDESTVTVGLLRSDDKMDLGPEPLSKILTTDVPTTTDKPLNTLHDESKATGAVKISIIVKYLVYMGGPFYWIFSMLLFVLHQVSQVATNVWIRQWANAYTRREMGTEAVDGPHFSSPVTHVQAGGLGGGFNCVQSGSCLWSLPFANSTAGAFVTLQNSDVDVGYYLGIYAVLGVAYMIITLVRDGTLFGGSIVASRRIHRQLMKSVTHAKFRFFDATPLGQIMNRFSKDVEAIDQEVAPVAVGVLHCLGSIITVVVLISVITPEFLIAGLFITVLYALIGAFFIRSSRDLKRLESVQRSPLYQQFGETLSGMTTIRAYGDERRFLRDNLNRVNTHSRPFIYLWSVNRWLAFRVDVVGALVAFFTGVFVLLSVGRVDAGAAGLALTYAVTFTENVLWFVRLYAANEQNMNAVERIKEYLDVDQEAAPVIPENRPAANWPSQGAVEFIDYSTRYRSDFDPVLRHITFKILPGEKVGVVGRTGAGKSSLALALFRALEAEEGKILVDGVDIGLIGLQDLRENIVMVPQDPTLFTGTIRSNLDPFGLFTDEEIYTVLRRVQLIGAPSATPSAAPSRPETPALKANGKSDSKSLLIAATSKLASSSTPNSPPSPTTSHLTMENKNIFRNLSTPVAESGSNLSQGQRQLLCLARAMLKNPKVLLMDEATASIDYATDAKIQETIRELRDNTIITIAHRLQTIIDYDKVLVLDRGAVVEFGDPFELISRQEGGVFRGMCETTGDFEVLEREAKKARDGRRLVDTD